MKLVLAILVGLIAGGLIAGFLMVRTMKTRMLATVESPVSFEETCAILEQAVADMKDKGWGFPMEKLNMYEKLAAKNQAPDNVTRMVSYFMCNPAMAGKVLEADPSLSAIMPCSWSIYETADGRVRISKMNVGLMSRIFGGTIQETMQNVEETEKEILNRILNKK